MIMLVAENAEPEVVGVGNIDEVIVTEVTIGINGPSGLRFLEVGNVKGIIGECGQDVGAKLFLVHDDGRTENRSKEFRSTE